jgi:ubiquinone/menaquinone biosynthesis C-methylase UbiE
MDPPAPSPAPGKLYDSPGERNEIMESNRAFYDRISRAYDLIADRDEHEAREAGERALDLRPGEQVLEIGFGTGNSVIELARRVGPKGRVHGIDVSTGMLEVAEDKIREAGLGDRIELGIADARDLPCDDDCLDAVFTSFTLELFDEEDIPRVPGAAAGRTAGRGLHGEGPGRRAPQPR